MKTTNILLRNALLILVLGFFFISCSQDNDSDDNEPEQVRLLLKEVRINEVLRSSYAYNDDNTIATRNSFNSSGELGSYEEYVYDSNTVSIHLFDSEGEPSTYFKYRKYFRVDANTIKREQYDIDDNLMKYRLYITTDDSCSHDKIEYYNADGSMIAYSVMTYSNANCEWISTYYDETGELQSSYEVTKDNKMSAYLSARIIVFGLDNSHNTLSATRSDEEGVINTSYSYTSTYEYNDDNYPTSSIKTTLDDTVNIYTYEYY